MEDHLIKHQFFWCLFSTLIHKTLRVSCIVAQIRAHTKAQLTRHGVLCYGMLCTTRVAICFSKFGNLKHIVTHEMSPSKFQFGVSGILPNFQTNPNIVVWLVVIYPSEKYEFVSWGYYSQYMESHKGHVPNHQPVIINHY